MGWFEPTIIWSISILFLIIIIVIFTKKTEQDERYIGWKMIGFFFLGTFTINLQGWVLPVGIAVFFLYFLPKLYQNKKAKMWAASLGVVSFLFNMVISHSVNAFYERDLTVRASSTNAFRMNFSKDYEKIKDALNVNGEVEINNLELSFHKGGKIQEFNYVVLYEKDGRNMIAWVQQINGSYKIAPSIQEEEELITMDGANYISSPTIYFRVMDQPGLKKMIPKGDSYHVQFSNSEEFFPAEEKTKLWDIQSDGIKEHVIEAVAEGNEEAGIPYQIQIGTMKKAGENSYTGDRYDFYTISPDLYE